MLTREGAILVAILSMAYIGAASGLLFGLFILFMPFC